MLITVTIILYYISMYLSPLGRNAFGACPGKHLSNSNTYAF